MFGEKECVGVVVGEDSLQVAQDKFGVDDTCLPEVVGSGRQCATCEIIDTVVLVRLEPSVLVVDSGEFFHRVRVAAHPYIGIGKVLQSLFEGEWQRGCGGVAGIAIVSPCVAEESAHERVARGDVPRAAEGLPRHDRYALGGAGQGEGIVRLGNGVVGTIGTLHTAEARTEEANPFGTCKGCGLRPFVAIEDRYAECGYLCDGGIAFAIGGDDDGIGSGHEDSLEVGLYVIAKVSDGGALLVGEVVDAAWHTDTDQPVHQSQFAEEAHVGSGGACDTPVGGGDGISRHGGAGLPRRHDSDHGGVAG